MALSTLEALSITSDQGGYSLLGRGAISSEGISAEKLLRRNPVEFERRLEEGYIVVSPTLTSVKGFSRHHGSERFSRTNSPFPASPNSGIDAVFSNATGSYLSAEWSTKTCGIYAPGLGQGDKNPLLGLIGMAP
ncbi:hypothetical protein GALL_311680 [mine drainage metagenome]|uniref:Uncharacterized protein n=1 Tax=mine drainage metagenome TaxID=410659 RepID=A0A1J5QTM0_9ZZZZ